MNKRDTIYQIITDHLGSPRLVVNVATGVVVQRIDYDEFGDCACMTAIQGSPKGSLWDSHSDLLVDFTMPRPKLVRFGAGRDYDAGTVCLDQKEPFDFGGEYPYLYSYVSNNPINNVDLSGLINKWPFNGRSSKRHLLRQQGIQLSGDAGEALRKEMTGKGEYDKLQEKNLSDQGKISILNDMKIGF